MRLTDSLGERAPFVRHSITSAEAAHTIAEKLPALQRRVWEYLVQQGAYGATDEEMQVWLRMPASTQRPRRVELVQRGLVLDSGTTRLTFAHRRAVVWIVKTPVPGALPEYRRVA